MTERSGWIWGLCAALALSGAACRSRTRDDGDEAADAREKAKQAEAAVVPYEGYREEPYDPKAPPTPHLQFMWQSPAQKREGIWSVALDGSGEVRLLASPELVYSGEAEVVREPVQSPDGRYIAWAGDSKDFRMYRILLDRQTRTVKTITLSDAGGAQFSWTPDSRHLLFYASLEVRDYDVATGKLEKVGNIPSKVLRLVDGGKKFLAVRKEAVEWYSRQGKLLGRKPLPFQYARVVAVSPSGRRVLFSGSLRDGRDGVFTVDPERPGERLHEIEGVFAEMVFSADDSTLYYDGASPRDRLTHLWGRELATGKPRDLAGLPGGVLSDFTLTGH